MFEVYDQEHPTTFETRISKLPCFLVFDSVSLFCTFVSFFLELFPKSFCSKRVSRVLLSRETPDSLSKSFFDRRHLQEALFKLELRE